MNGTTVLGAGAAVEAEGGTELVKAEGREVIRQSDSGRLGSIDIPPEVSLSYTCLGSSIDDLQGDTRVLRPRTLSDSMKRGAYEGTQPSRQSCRVVGAYDSQLEFAAAHKRILPAPEASGQRDEVIGAPAP